MELKLDRKEIEEILLAHANKLLLGDKFNHVEWDGYRSPGGVTFDHTDVPQEDSE